MQLIELNFYAHQRVEKNVKKNKKSWKLEPWYTESNYILQRKRKLRKYCLKLRFQEDAIGFNHLKEIY